MSKNSEHHDTYIIPPNFIEGSTLFSLDLSLTVRIIILCLTALPLALFALMGIAGEPLSSYIIAFFKWLKNRRVVGKTEPKEERKKPKPKKEKQPAPENESMLSASSRQRKSIPRNPGRRKHRNRRSRTAEAKRTRPFSTP